MEPETLKDRSSVYYVVTESTDTCEICFNRDGGLVVSTKCNHSFCKNCLMEYYRFLKYSGEFEFNCPSLGCGKDAQQVLLSILDETEYKNFIRLHKRNKRLRDPNIVWCPVVNCDGYGIVDKNKAIKCRKCDVEITVTVNPSSKELLKDHSLVECPACKALVIRTFGCLTGRCYCGTEFCLKCLRENSRDHRYWKCIGSNNEEISWWVIIISLFSPCLVPVLPVCLVYLYRHEWDRNYVKVLNERPFFYAFFLFLFSPMIFVFSLFYLPFIWGWYCVESMVYSKSSQLSSSWLFFKIFIYFPSVFLTFLAYLLVLGLVISFAPLYGLVLLTQKLTTGKNAL